MDLKDLAPEVTHNLWRDVQNGDGRINLLVTISGTTRGDSPSNLLNYEQDIDKLQSQWMERYVSCMFVHYKRETLCSYLMLMHLLSLSWTRLE